MTTQKRDGNNFRTPIVTCPLDNLADGAVINLESGTFRPDGPLGAWRVDDMAHYRGAVLSLHFQNVEDGTDQAWNTVEGSAVLVGPGVALSAAHGLAELIVPLTEGKLIASCTGYTQSGPQLWRIASITTVNGTDLALLALEYRSPLPAENKFSIAQMTTRLPAIDEKVLIVGFSASTEKVDAIGYEANVPYFPVRDGVVRFGLELRVGIGLVTQHFLNGRGACPPGPTVEVDVAATGGMSGGAAFDSRGYLFGIISRSVDHEGGAGTTFISHVVPSLGTRVNVKFGNLFSHPSINLVELHPRTITIDGSDKLAVTEAPDLGLTRIEWDN